MNSRPVTPLELAQAAAGRRVLTGAEALGGGEDPRRSCVVSVPVLRVADGQVIDYLNSSPNVKDCQVR